MLHFNKKILNDIFDFKIVNILNVNLLFEFQFSKNEHLLCCGSL